MKAKNIRYMANGSNNGFRMVIVKRVLPFYLFVFLPLLSSCTLETSKNGKLDGMWLLTTVDTLATGGSSEVRESLITWSFQVHLMQLRHPNGRMVFHFQHDGNKLILNDAVIDDRMSGDIPVTDNETMQRVGLTQPEDTFTVNNLSSSNLDIANRQYRLRFRKY